MKLYLLLIVIIMFSCENIKNEEIRDKTIIPVAETVGTGEILNLSDYAKSVEYIPLETNDSVLVGNIEQVIFENNHIILRDFQNNMCVVFDNTGHFKTQLGKRGNGPGEYSYVYSMNFLNLSNDVFIDAYPKHYYIYDLEGHLKKSIPCVKVPEPFRALTTVALTSDIYFSHLGAMGDFRYRGLAWGEKDGTPVYKLFSHYFEFDRADEIEGYRVSTNKWRYKDELRCHWREKDTIFTINKNLDLKKAFVLDLGKYNLTYDEMFLSKGENNKYISLSYGQTYESSHYLFLKFDFNDLAPEVYKYRRRNPRGFMQTVKVTSVCGLFDKETGKLTLLNQPVRHKYLGFKNDLDGGPCFWPKYVSSDDKMVTWWLAEEFLDIYRELPDPSPELKKMAEKLTPDDNPVLMVVTLK